MNLADLLVIALLAAGVFFAVRAIRRGHTGGCSGNCAGCGGHCAGCSQERPQ